MSRAQVNFSLPFPLLGLIGEKKIHWEGRITQKGREKEIFVASWAIFLPVRGENKKARGSALAKGQDFCFAKEIFNFR